MWNSISASKCTTHGAEGYLKKKKCGVRECKSVLRCGLIWQRALKLCDICFLFGLLARWSFDSFGQSDCVSQTDLFSRVFISLCEWSFFLSDHQFSLHFIRNVVTKYENFRIKLQVEQQIWREKKKKTIHKYSVYIWLLQIIGIITSNLMHFILWMLRMYYFFQQITHCDDLFLCYWWCALDCVSECSWCKRKQIRFVDIDSKKKENTALNEFPSQKKNGTKKMPVFKAATAYTVSALKSKAKTQTSAKS